MGTDQDIERIARQVPRVDVLRDWHRRLVGALLLEQNDEWQLQRRYLQLEGLQAPATINLRGSLL